MNIWHIWLSGLRHTLIKKHDIKTSDKIDWVSKDLIFGE